MPRLRILAGPSLSSLTPVEVNSDVPVHVKSSGFEGQVAVYIKGWADGTQSHSEYFDHKDRKGITWSIQMQGRFLHTHSADDIMFGNIFDRPLKLPWGFGAALRFMRYVDPTLEEELTSKSRPWAFSPFVATMPHIHHTRLEHGEAPLPFPSPRRPVADDMSSLRTRSSTSARHFDVPHHHRKQRKAFFKSAEKRKDVVFGPNDMITADFSHHYLEFGEDSIVLRLPCGIAIDLLRYWDGQPVRFVCCERAKGSSKNKTPWGRVFFCVVVERVDDDSDGGEKLYQRFKE